MDPRNTGTGCSMCLSGLLRWDGSKSSQEDRITPGTVTERLECRNLGSGVRRPEKPRERQGAQPELTKVGRGFYQL